MADGRGPVLGRLYIKGLPGLVTLDVSPLVELAVHEVLDLLMTEEFLDSFIEIASAEPVTAHDGHTPERLAFEQLLAALVAQVSTRQALTGRHALRVGREIVAHAERIIAVERAAANVLQLVAARPVRKAS